MTIVLKGNVLYGHNPLYLILAKYLNGEINPDLNPDGKTENKLFKDHRKDFWTGYKDKTFGFIDGRKFILIAHQPKNHLFNNDFYSITLHLSQWSNLKEVVDKFIEIFGPEITRTIFNEWKVTRLDACLDLPLPYDLMMKSIFRSGASISEKHKSDKRTYYLGASHKKIGLFYEKDRKDLNSSCDLKLADSNLESDKITRVEVRYFRKNVPIKSFSDYGKLADLKLFDFLSCMFFSTKKFESVRGEYHNERIKKFNAFRDLVEKEGLHLARRSFNSQRDFYRTILPILARSSKKLNFDDLWRKKIESRFVGRFDVHRYLESHCLKGALNA